MKIFRVISIFILIFIILGVVFADDSLNYSNTTTKLNFEGVNFIIPEGYGEIGDIENYDKLGSEGKTCKYVNSDKNKIEITVISDWMGISLDELYKDGAFKKTINKHKGWFYSQKDLTYFAYVDDDKGVLVGVSNQSSLFQIIT